MACQASVSLTAYNSQRLRGGKPAAPTYRIPLDGLPAGMYVVSVQVGGEVVQKKLVVD